MTTKWTLGPWHVAGNHLQDIEIKDASGFIVGRANLFAESYGDLKHLANAQLIASAPDLAERLELTNQQIKHAMDVLQGQHESTWQSLSDCLYANERALGAARGENND